MKITKEYLQRKRANKFRLIISIIFIGLTYFIGAFTSWNMLWFLELGDWNWKGRLVLLFPVFCWLLVISLPDNFILNS